MTNEEAKRYILENWFDGDQDVKAVVGGDKETMAMKMAVEAIEKQIPKKLTHEATLYKCCTCQNCKNGVDEYKEFAVKKARVTYTYCHHCGQKLDWGDTE